MCFFIWLMGVGLHLTMQKAKADDAVVATGGSYNQRNNKRKHRPFASAIF